MKNLNKLVVAYLVCAGIFTAPLAQAFTYDGSYANKSAGARQSSAFRSVTNLTALSLQSVAKAVVNHINNKKPPAGVYTEAYQTSPSECGFTPSTSYTIKAPSSPLINAVCAVDTYTVSSSGSISAKVYVWGVPNPQSTAYFSAGLHPGSNAQLRADYAIAGSVINRFNLLNASTGVVQSIGRGVEYLADNGGPYKSGTSASPPPILGSTNAKALSPVVYFTWTGTNGGGNPSKPTVNLSASPTSVSYGGSSTLTWSSKNATSCTLNGASVATSGSKSTGALYSSKSYTLSCTGKGGSNSASASVSVGSPPKPSVSVSASPNPVNYGQKTTVSWSSSNTNSCTFSGSSVGTSGSKTEGPIKSSQTFTVSCRGPGGSASGSVTVKVIYPKPTVNIYAIPNPVAYGGSPRLVWTSTGATSCSISGIGSVSTSGAKVVGPLTTAQTYSISCKGRGGTASASTTENVIAPPKPRIFMFVSPTSLSAPGSVTISYFTRNASSCRLSPGGSVPTGGTFLRRLKKVERISSTTTFTMTCTGPGGTVSHSKTVTVSAPKPSITFTDRWNSVTYGGRDYLSWTSSNVTSCTLNGRSVALNASGYATPRLYRTITYTLSCKGPGGSVSKSLKITVSSPPKPRIRWFTYTPSPTVPYDTSAQLHWGSVNTNYCTVNGVRHGAYGPLTVGPLKKNTTYTLKCYGPGGSVSRSLTVRVAAPPSPTIKSFTARWNSVSRGGYDYLSWSTANVTSCTLNGRSVAVNASSYRVRLWGTKTYTLTCTGAGGTVSRSLTIRVYPRPSITFSATPTSVRYGGSSTLAWSSSNASSCTLNGSGVGTRGSKSTGALYSSTTYTLRCTGPGGSASKSVTVNVALPPKPVINSFTASPRWVRLGGASTLSWSTSNATSCSINGVGVGVNGSKSTGGLRSTTTFTLSCSNPSGSVSQSVTVNVLRTCRWVRGRLVCF